jgi:hypothetical protein
MFTQRAGDDSVRLTSVGKAARRRMGPLASSAAAVYYGRKRRKPADILKNRAKGGPLQNQVFVS